jgi:Protein of unknown function (DUF3631)/Toprim-like
MAKCPAHEDCTQSLSVSESTGKILVHCFAGCSIEKICAALSIHTSDLFTGAPRSQKQIPRSTQNESKKATMLVAEYIYRDEAGNPVAKKQRFEPKSFTWHRWEKTGETAGEWKMGLGAVKTPLYRWNEVKESSLVILTEGEKDADAGAVAGFPCATSGGVNSWRLDHAELLAGKDVIVIADADDPGRLHAAKIAASIFGRVQSVKLVEFPQSKDLAEFLSKGVPRETLQAFFDEAKPWHPPTGEDLIDEMKHVIRRWIAMTDAEATCCALWVAHTHAIAYASYTPYISIFSPERECGKSNLMTVLEYHCAKPMRSVSVSQSALFRAIELWKPTFLLDEFDTVMRGDHETREMIRCVLNAGFERGQYAIRNAGQGANMEPKQYDTFGPKVIAGIGELEQTIASRSIPIRLKHALPGEYDENFDKDTLKVEAAKLRVEIAAWADSVKEQLKNDKPEIPRELRGRRADICKPLLAIADAAGGHWPERARQALIEIFSDDRHVKESDRLMLLRHLYERFVPEDGEPLEFVSTPEMIEWLTSRDDWPWSEYGKARKPITGPQIARLLRAFDVENVRVRVNGERMRGYTLAGLRDAFNRYVQPVPSLKSQSGTDGETPASGT